ncbi:RDD family protein [Streptomyces sp. NPDC057381]|uniref:RDD family protein n=1 Tax=Streptomyces sp. NPDC057381 TaxID=3346111 RepID=UPI00362FCA64
MFSWFVATYLLYFPFCVSEFGSTLGKRICGRRVAHRDTGRNIGFGPALVREISWPVFSLVPVLGLLNSLWCCWDQPYRQCLTAGHGGRRPLISVRIAPLRTNNVAYATRRAQGCSRSWSFE